MVPGDGIIHLQQRLYSVCRRLFCDVSYLMAPDKPPPVIPLPYTPRLPVPPADQGSRSSLTPPDQHRR